MEAKNIEITKLLDQKRQTADEMEELTENHPFTTEHQRRFDSLKTTLVGLDARLKKLGVERPVLSPDQFPAPYVEGAGADLRSVASRPEHRSMFPDLHDERTGFQSFSDFARAMKSGRHDDRLEDRAMTGAVGSDGGYSVPIQWERYILDAALGNEVIRPLVKNIPMSARTIRIPGWDTTDLSAGGVGGAVAYWTSEGGSITETSPKQRQVELSAKKLAILEKSSLELAEDAPDFAPQVADQIGKTLGHYLDKALIRGTGAGQPLGILNSPCLIEVAAEGTEGAGGLVLENAVKMYARMLPIAQRRMVWIANPDCIPQLYTFSIAVGTGGSWVSPMSEQDGQFRILGRPVYFSSHCSTVGTAGDLIALDPESYAVGILGGSMRMDYSDHVYFASAQRAFRALVRVDGQCLVEDEITPAQGSNSWSPIVTVASRS